MMFAGRTARGGVADRATPRPAIRDSAIDNFLVKKVIQQRWQRHSECTSRQYGFEQCYKHILGQDRVTPASIANDGRFKRIYSNYPL
jgi:hypothetical protein